MRTSLYEMTPQKIINLCDDISHLNETTFEEIKSDYRKSLDGKTYRRFIFLGRRVAYTDEQLDEMVEKALETEDHLLANAKYVYLKVNNQLKDMLRCVDATPTGGKIFLNESDMLFLTMEE